MSKQDTSELVGAHKGETIFVVGNAPSLNDTDLTRVSDRFVTIGCNRILLHPTFKPTYLFGSDRRPYYAEIDNGNLGKNADAIKIMLSTTIFDPAISCYNTQAAQEPSFRWYPWRVGVSSSPFNWTNFSEPLCSFGSITGPMIQAAVIMGAARVCIVGVDMQVPKTEKGETIHFYKHEGNWEGYRTMPEMEPGGAIINDKSVEVYRRAFRELGKMGVSVFNLNPWINTRFSTLFGSTNINAFMEKYA